MGMLIDQERALYGEMFDAVDCYSTMSPGVRCLPAFLQMVGDRRGTVLDAGCGTGKAAVALEAAGFSVTCCDLMSHGMVREAARLPFIEASLWSDLLARVGHCDWVYCTDVLEHIPTPFTMLAIHQMLRVARYGVFLSIAVNADNMGAWLGEELHKTVQPFTSWRDQLAELGVVREARDLMTNGVFYVVPR